MSRSTFRNQCSEWRVCLVSCLCCRHRDTHRDTPGSEVTPLNVVNTGQTVNVVNTGQTDPPPPQDSHPADAPPLDRDNPIPIVSHPGNPPAQSYPTFNVKNPSPEDDKLLDDFIERCEQLLRGSSQGETSSNRIIHVASRFVEYKESGKSFIDGLPKDFTNQVDQDLLSPLLSTAIKGVAGLHWMVAGLSLVAWSLDVIDQNEQNSKECLEQLSRTIQLMKITKHIWKSSSVDSVTDSVADFLQDTILIVLRCALTCASTMKSNSFLRLLNAKTIKESIDNLGRDLDRALQQNVVVVGVDTQARVRTVQAGVETLLDRSKFQRQITYPIRDDIVGEDDVEQKAMLCLEKDGDEIVAVCLHGMGGIGKSTIGGNIFGKFQAKSAARQRTYKFCRVELPFVTKREDLPKYQLEVLGRLCPGSTGVFSDCSDGKIWLERELKNIKEPVFLYLDNVLEKSHLSELLPEARSFPKCSRVLVTTRNEEVFKGMRQILGRSSTCELVRVKGLDRQQARELLWRHVKDGNRGSLNGELEALEGEVLSNRWSLNGELKALEKEVLDLCNGLPLALIVVGRFIGHSDSGPTDSKEWKKVMEGMKEGGGTAWDDDLNSLKFSIDLLNDKDRKAFLDIVAFAEGRRWDVAECLVGRLHLESLRQRALVEKDEKDVDAGYWEEIVRVHDVMKALGLEMVKRDEKEIRVVTKDDLDDIRERWGSVVGLMEVSVDAPLLQKMPRLRILRDVRIQGECQAARLRHLSVVAGMEGPSMPFDISACTALKCLSWKGGDASNLKVTSKSSTLEYSQLIIILRLKFSKDIRLAFNTL